MSATVYGNELLEKIKTAKDSLKKGSVLVEYIGDDCIIGNQRFPKGKLTCDLMNIADDKVKEICRYTEEFIQLGDFFYFLPDYNGIPIEIVEKSRLNALKIVEILETTEPFSYFKKQDFIANYDMLNTSAIAFEGTLPPIVSDSSTQINSILRVMALGRSIPELKQKLVEFCKMTDHDLYDRSEKGFAKAYEKIFSDCDPAKGEWMPFSTVYREAIALNGNFGYRMEYFHFMELVGGDFFEGIKAGHAPKKCRMCGRYFLTTDAHHPHYCNEPNPDDARGRTCRKLAKLGGSTEKAKDNPRIVIKNKALANLRQLKSRGRVTEDEYQYIYDLIIEKSEKAAEKSEYCNGAYAREMKMKNLRMEAGISQ